MPDPPSVNSADAHQPYSIPILLSIIFSPQAPELLSTKWSILPREGEGETQEP
jgi:hypothetical protein